MKKVLSPRGQTESGGKHTMTELLLLNEYAHYLRHLGLLTKIFIEATCIERQLSRHIPNILA